MTNIFKKIDTFNHILETLKEELEEGHTSMLKKIEDNLKKASEYTNGEIIKISKEQVKLEKAIDKKVNGLDQKL